MPPKRRHVGSGNDVQNAASLHFVHRLTVTPLMCFTDTSHINSFASFPKKTFGFADFFWKQRKTV